MARTTQETPIQLTEAQILTRQVVNDFYRERGIPVVQPAEHRGLFGPRLTAFMAPILIVAACQGGAEPTATPTTLPTNTPAATQSFEPSPSIEVSPLPSPVEPTPTPVVSPSPVEVSPSPVVSPSPKAEKGTTPEKAIIIAADVVKEINDKYGVVIAAPAKEYSQESFDQNSTLTANVLPTLEQALAIETALAKTPSPKSVAPLIICFQNPIDPTAPDVAQGGFLGSQWPLFFRPSQIPANATDSYFLQYDQSAGKFKPAIELDLSNNGLSQNLPEQVNGSNYLSLDLQEGLRSSGVTLNLTQDASLVTQGDRLEEVVGFAYVYAIEDTFSRTNASSLAEYEKRQGTMPISGITDDSTNPLYETYAKLTDWKLTSDAEIMRQYNPNADPKELKLLTGSHWERNPITWGDLANRHGGLTVVARYAPIQEALAGDWAIFESHPELLSPKVQAYFQKLDAGLGGSNPEQFIKAVIKDPNVLLQ